MITYEEKKTEALNRMKALKLIPECVKAFKNGNIWCSRYNGTLFELDKEEKELVKKFEDEHNALVYHTIRTATPFGELLNILFVSNYNEEWELDRDDISDDTYLTPFVMCINLNDKFSSDMGYIVVKSQFGGLIRIE